MRAMHASVLASAGSANEGDAPLRRHPGADRARPGPKRRPRCARSQHQLRALQAPGLAGEHPGAPHRESRGIVGLRSQMLPGAGRDRQADPGPVQPHPIRGNRALENSRTLGRGELLPGGQPQDLLVAGLQAAKAMATAWASSVTSSGSSSGPVRVRPRATRRAGGAPWPGAGAGSRFRTGPPGRAMEWRLPGRRRGVARPPGRSRPRPLGPGRPHTALGEVTHTRMVFTVERGEALRVIGNRRAPCHRGIPSRDG